MAKNRPNAAPELNKIAPRWPQMYPRLSKMAQRLPKMTSGWHNDGTWLDMALCQVNFLARQGLDSRSPGHLVFQPGLSTGILNEKAPGVLFFWCVFLFRLDRGKGISGAYPQKALFANGGLEAPAKPKTKKNL